MRERYGDTLARLTTRCWRLLAGLLVSPEAASQDASSHPSSRSGFFSARRRLSSHPPTPPRCAVCLVACVGLDSDCDTTCGDGTCVGNAGEMCNSCQSDCMTTNLVCG